MERVNLIELAQKTIEIEKDALIDLAKSIDDRFLQAMHLLSDCKGRVIITGIGKSAIVAQKMVATFNSTGTQSIFMHAADAVHGDLGMIDDADIVICISKSGETPELKVLVPILKSYRVQIIAMTAQEQSYLATHADALLYTPVSEEADPNKLAPTTSTTVQSSMGDAVAIILLTKKGFTPAHFAKYHPGGSLGKQLYLQVSDLIQDNAKPQVGVQTEIKEVLLSMSQARMGATVVVDEHQKMLGIITDGDVRRWFQNNSVQEEAYAQKMMTENPLVVQAQSMAVEAFQLLRDNNISQLPVVEKDQYVGMIHINDLLREGFV